MKIIATVTLFGDDRLPTPPGEKVDLPAAEAKSLVDRGFAVFPPAAKSNGKPNSGEGEPGVGDGKPAGEENDSGGIVPPGGTGN